MRQAFQPVVPIIVARIDSTIATIVARTLIATRNKERRRRPRR